MPTHPSFSKIKFKRSKAKRGKPSVVQTFLLPASVSAYIHLWWREKGSPDAGPVFPVREGETEDGFKARRGTSYALRLREGLHLAGIRRHHCKRPATAPRRERGEDCCPGVKYDPLFYPQEDSSPVDFHSFRRAFTRATKAAGINQQTSMALVNHSDAKTHAGYLESASTPMALPESALVLIAP